MRSLSGILPAVVTPVDAEGRFRQDAFERLLERLYEAGVHGAYVCGSTGEGMQQSLAQRREVAEAAIRHSPQEKHVIVHVGASNLNDAVQLAEHAAAAGAAAISSLPPSGSYSSEDTRTYYERLAGAVDIPLLLYSLTDYDGGIGGIDDILTLCTIPNVIGLKFSDFDLYTLSVLRSKGLTVFNGKDEVLAAGLLMGASGGIGTFYNVLPELFVRLYDLAQAGEWEEARAVQMHVNEVIQATLRYPVFAAIKAILSWSGIDCGPCLLPRRALTDEEAANLKRDLRAIGAYEMAVDGRSASIS